MRLLKVSHCLCSLIDSLFEWFELFLFQCCCHIRAWKLRCFLLTRLYQLLQAVAKEIVDGCVFS